MFVFNVSPTAEDIMETRLVRQTGGAWDQTRDPWLHGDLYIHYTMAAPGWVCNRPNVYIGVRLNLSINVNWSPLLYWK